MQDVHYQLPGTDQEYVTRVPDGRLIRDFLEHVRAERRMPQLDQVLLDGSAVELNDLLAEWNDPAAIFLVRVGEAEPGTAAVPPPVLVSVSAYPIVDSIPGALVPPRPAAPAPVAPVRGAPPPPRAGPPPGPARLFAGGG